MAASRSATPARVLAAAPAREPGALGKRVLTVAAADAAGHGSLPDFLAARLGLARDAAAALVQQGAVWLERRRATGSEALAPGQRVTVFLPSGASTLPQGAASCAPGAALSPTVQPTPTMPTIVYEDDVLLVVDKPAGLLSQPGRRGGPSVLSLLTQEQGLYKGAPLYLVHRLDAEASGLLLLARDRAVCPLLDRALRGGRIRRRYLALAQGSPPDEGTIDLRIGPAAATGPMASLRRCYPSDSPHGQPALTRYRVLHRYAAQPASDGASARAPRALLSVELTTGRTHQIRAHLAAIGCPLVGDRAYGSQSPVEPGDPPDSADDDRLLLHAVQLELRHPLTRARLNLVAPPPPALRDPGAGSDPPRT